MRGSTFTLGPSRFDRWNDGKISHLFLSPLSLSLSLSDFSLSPLLALLFFFFFFFLPLSTRTTFSCLFHPYLFSFLSIFSFHFFPFSLFSFSLLFIFLFSPPSSFSPTRMDQVGETSSHFPPWLLVITMFFILFSFSLLLHHVTHGSM